MAAGGVEPSRSMMAATIAGEALGGQTLDQPDGSIRRARQHTACLKDRRRPELIEHAVTTLVGQRVSASCSATST